MLKTKKQLLLPVGSVMRKDDYWPLADEAKKDYENKYTGTLGFDLYTLKFHDVYDQGGFISVHKSSFDEKWSIHAPLFLCDEDGTRPSFERDHYLSFTDCLMSAIELAVKNDTFVVIVDDPKTGKTMQPSREYPQI